MLKLEAMSYWWNSWRPFQQDAVSCLPFPLAFHMKTQVFCSISCINKPFSSLTFIKGEGREKGWSSVLMGKFFQGSDWRSFYYFQVAWPNSPEKLGFCLFCWFSVSFVSLQSLPSENRAHLRVLVLKPVVTLSAVLMWEFLAFLNAVANCFMGELKMKIFN